MALNRQGYGWCWCFVFMLLGLAWPALAQPVTTAPLPPLPAAKPQTAAPKPAAPKVEVKPKIKTEPAAKTAAKNDAAKTRANDPASLPLAKDLLKDGGQLFYIGKAHGLETWLHIQNLGVSMFYVAPDNNALVVGAMIGRDASNLTQQQLTEAYLNNADLRAALQRVQSTLNGDPAAPPVVNNQLLADSDKLSRPEQLWRLAEKAPRVQAGNVGPLLVALVEPACAACYALWRQLQPLVAAGRLQLALLLVAAPDSTAENQAAKIIGADNGLALWQQLAGGDNLENIPLAEGARAKVRQNFAMAENWGMTKTPFLIYRNKNQQLKLLAGLPQELNVLYDDLGLSPAGSAP